MSLVALTEVEFFTEKKATNKQMSLNPFDYLAETVSITSGLRLEVKDFNQDGNEDILLENNYMLYVIEPVFGGVVNYAYDKQAKMNLVKYHDASAWGGLSVILSNATGEVIRIGFALHTNTKSLNKALKKPL